MLSGRDKKKPTITLKNRCLYADVITPATHNKKDWNNK